MKILVCVKQVVESTSPLEIDPEKGWIRDSGSISCRMNRFDEYALEEAVQIKEKLAGVTIDALSIGPERVRSVLTKALEKGADNAVYIPDTSPGYTLPAARAAIIAWYASSGDYDLIFTGVMAEDDMESQVGPLTAAKLDIPCAVSVISEVLSPGENKITIESEIEKGIRAKAELSLPALLTIQSGINRPRYPSLSNVLRAKAQKIPELIPPEPLLAAINPGISLSIPQKLKQGTVIEGTTEEKADRLISILRSKSLLS
ncbi:MAG: electron transfer flavoprotein subunit beta/FixA family protein [bacterium]|nr:electron transfer flavoprotein subunit beta/FixA family protein [bacterium]